MGLDRRVHRSREAVLGATFELLTESGLGGVSVDEVSRRSGVAKTTIYRHWDTRSDLILDACARISADQEAPDTGSFEGDATALLTGIARLLRTANWSSVVPSIVDAAERDPEVAAIHGRIQRGAHGTVARDHRARGAQRRAAPGHRRGRDDGGPSRPPLLPALVLP